MLSREGERLYFCFQGCGELSRHSGQNSLMTSWERDGTPGGSGSLKMSRPMNGGQKELPSPFFLWIVISLLLFCSLIYGPWFTFLICLLDFRFMSPFCNGSWWFLVELSSSQWITEDLPVPISNPYTLHRG